MTGHLDGPSGVRDTRDDASAPGRPGQPDRRWLEWLARSGYGIDYRFDEDPPVALDVYAAVMAEVAADGESVEAWAWCIEKETGPWRGKALTTL